MIKAFWRKESPKEWSNFFRHNIIRSNGLPIYPECVEFMRGFVARHIPIKEANLLLWEKEAVICGGSYAEELKRDILWARKCNAKQDEVILINVLE